MNRNSAPLLNVTNFKMGPLGEKSSVPGFPLVPLEQAPDTTKIERSGRSTAAARAGAAPRRYRLHCAVFVLLAEDGRYRRRAAVEDNVTDDNAWPARIAGILQRLALHGTKSAFEGRGRASSCRPGSECTVAAHCDRADHGDDE